MTPLTVCWRIFLAPPARCGSLMQTSHANHAETTCQQQMKSKWEPCVVAWSCVSVVRLVSTGGHVRLSPRPAGGVGGAARAPSLSGSDTAGRRVNQIRASLTLRRSDVLIETRLAAGLSFQGRLQFSGATA